MHFKVIGLFALYVLISALGLLGIYLRASETDTPPPTPPPVIQAPPVAAPARPVAGQIGQIGGVGKFGQFGQQFDLAGKKVIGIEDGPAQVLATRTSPPGLAPPTTDGFVNPKVEPGKVKWHPDFDTACTAAAKSGKPVLLFQMMGKLDDQFC
jgi:hypothetical protein